MSIPRCGSGKEASFLSLSFFPCLLFSSLVSLSLHSRLRLWFVLSSGVSTHFHVNERMSERTSGGYNLPYTRAHYRNSPDRLGSGATIRCPTEKPASHGTGFRCTRVFVRLAVEPVAYRAHRFHCGLSHVVRSVA